MSKDDPAKSKSLLAFLDELEPLDEDFPVTEDPPVRKLLLFWDQAISDGPSKKDRRRP
jgi:hypothetical protein